MSEIWASIPGYPGYEASDAGGVRNSSGALLKPWSHRSGHLYVSLGRGNKFQVHHLVLSAFGIDRPEGMECRHLDGDATNNTLGNLVWGTRAENIADLKHTSGRYAKASISDEVALEIRRKFTGKHGEQTKLANEYRLHLSTVNRIIRGRTYVHLGD